MVVIVVAFVVFLAVVAVCTMAQSSILRDKVSSSKTATKKIRALSGDDWRAAFSVVVVVIK